MDFGPVDEENLLAHDFTLRNPGAVAAEIVKVSAMCVCTDVKAEN